MKKYFVVLLCGLMLFGCAKKDKNDSVPPTPTPDTVVQDENPALNLSYHDFIREVSVLDCSSNLRWTKFSYSGFWSQSMTNFPSQHQNTSKNTGNRWAQSKYAFLDPLIVFSFFNVIVNHLIHLSQTANTVIWIT